MKLKYSILVVFVVDILVCCWVLMPDGRPDGLTSLFEMVLAAAAMLIVAGLFALSKKKNLALCFLVNTFVVPIFVWNAILLVHRINEYREYGAITQYVCYGVKWKQGYFDNIQLELRSRNSTCEICSFDERYPGGGFSGSSGYYDGTYVQQADNSYLLYIEEDTLLLRNDTLYGILEVGVPVEKVR